MYAYYVLLWTYYSMYKVQGTNAFSFFQIIFYLLAESNILGENK